jgi:hypothetical protein
MRPFWPLSGPAANGSLAPNRQIGLERASAEPDVPPVTVRDVAAPAGSQMDRGRSLWKLALSPGSGPPTPATYLATL